MRFIGKGDALLLKLVNKICAGDLVAPWLGLAGLFKGAEKVFFTAFFAAFFAAFVRWLTAF